MHHPNLPSPRGHCCAFAYTQLTDIEQEANALYSFDREDKLDATEVKAVLDARILRQSRLLLEGAAPVGAVLDDMDVEQGQKLRLICPSRSRMVPPQDVIRVTTA
ncbi:hypothetical protein G6O67_004248 [Ophiocordyceps sinensis]|uniref:Uncharacterized protein n=1 Tax=Ophiocordyceps sinensis TaxID=72228 RepID=A0A8H4LZA3_9HYPO|nr:hypothetical protein G6O67_004248 [Ophiocordyceps sinensis]